jgi:hypothetical protein
MLVYVRPSNEALLRARVPLARSFIPSFPLSEGDRTVVHCAHRTSTVSSCAFCEQEGQSVTLALSFVRFHVGSKECIDPRLITRPLGLEPI